MAKRLCRLLGIVLVVMGILGFVAPNLLGMHLSVPHNIFHLVTGALAIYFGFGRTLHATRTFNLIFGVLYLLLGILGFVAPMVVADLLRMQDAPGPVGSIAPDNLINLLLGAVFLVGRFVRSPHTTPITT
jgi:uncharacterized membrane protein HdeD (DUF308 family)